MMNAALPNIHLVTPNYNGADYLEDTLLSVLDQNYPNIHYAIVDGGSTDGSIDILARYRDQLSEIVIEPDGGHADALNKGFSTPRGDIMGWINSDDILLPGCLSIVGRIFATYPEVSWITGLPTTCDLTSKLTYVGPTKHWSRLRFLAGDHLWIQQESTFWRRSLWDEAGGLLDTRFKVANDFELWSRFFRHADLHTVESMLGCFRVREGQRSDVDRARYMREVDTVLKRELDQLAPDFRETFGSLVPRSPRLLEPETRLEFESELSQADPPIITRRGLRRHEPLHHRDVAEMVAAPRHPVNPISSVWRGVARRNWRFLVAGAALCVTSLLAAATFANWAIWIALAAGLGASIGLTLAIAIKVRRILQSLIRSINDERLMIANSTLSRHMAELELDELYERTSD
ncbi:glycosyltransferase [Maricaulis maris]|uniref:glycosyltransferase n=1 Tax=Maricaulis maris TaxID=74318 RepID=UPI0029215A1B|nr:hypothetical protein MACH15_24270 [Maricaulis maris]